MQEIYLRIISLFQNLVENLRFGVEKGMECKFDLRKHINIKKKLQKIRPLRGNPTDRVLDLVIKTKFNLKIMKFVANFEKLV